MRRAFSLNRGAEKVPLSGKIPSRFIESGRAQEKILKLPFLQGES